MNLIKHLFINKGDLVKFKREFDSKNRYTKTYRVRFVKVDENTYNLYAGLSEENDHVIIIRRAYLFALEKII